MQLTLTTIFFLNIIFSSINGHSLSHIEYIKFEKYVKNVETILFGRFNWKLSINHFNEVYYNTYGFMVYCTIKKSKLPDNVPYYIYITIKDNSNDYEDKIFNKKPIHLFLETEMHMRKNNWFILFPKLSDIKNTWIIHNRSEVFNLENDLELQIFEQFCFLKPKLPLGKRQSNFCFSFSYI